MYKMYFNTGVKPVNRLNKDNKLVLSNFETIKDGTLQIEYFLERKPEDNLILKFLAQANYLENLKPYEVAIKIVGGGMLSEYAIFNRV